MWHIQKAGTNTTYTAPDLQTLQIWCREGRVTEQDHVRQDPDPNWVTAGSVFELTAFFARPLSQMGQRHPTSAAPRGAPAAAAAAARGSGGGLVKRSGQADGDNLDLDLTSMMDMTFILLIFLMVISTPAFQHGLPVNLPQSDAGGKIEKTDVTVSISKAGEISVDDQRAASIAELESMLKVKRRDPTFGKLILRADGEVTHQKVVDVMGAIKTSGISDVSIATKPKQK